MLDDQIRNTSMSNLVKLEVSLRKTMTTYVCVAIETNSLYLDDGTVVVNKQKHVKALSEQHVVNNGGLEYSEFPTVETKSKAWTDH